MDSRGRLFVGDRSNNRVLIFDQDGTLLDEWRQFSRPSGLFIDAQDMRYASSEEIRQEPVDPTLSKGVHPCYEPPFPQYFAPPSC